MNLRFSFLCRLAFLLPSIFAFPAPIHASQFLTAKEYQVGQNSRAVAAGDLNHDGILDLVVLNAGHLTRNTTVSVLLGKVGGNFGNPIDYPVTGGGTDIVVGDFDHDGNLDIAAATGWGLNVLLGNGDGTFRPSTLFSNIFARWLFVADFDGDRNLDLFVTYGDEVFLCRGNGHGKFFPQQLIAYVNYLSTKPVMGDFNGDGKLDFAIMANTSFSNTLYVYLGNGDGTFNAGLTYAVIATANAIVAGDFNGDGKLDIAVSIATDLQVLTGNGDGTFLLGKLYPNATDSAVNTMVAADFNGDGILDLAATNTETFNVSVLLGKGNATFSKTTNWVVGNPSQVIAADFNGDRLPDLAVVDQSGAVDVLLAQGGGSFQAARDIYSSNFPRFFATGDFNEDGITDIVIPGADVFLGLGGGTFAPPVYYQTGNLGPLMVVTTNLNGDGHLDLVVATSEVEAPGAVAVLLGNGDGTFQPATIYTTGNWTSWLAVGDFNGDGVPDLIVSNLAANANLFIGNGDGTFQPSINSTIPATQWIIAADFNNDGKLDVATAGVDVFLGNGDGTFRSGFGQSSFGNYMAIPVDLNGDGNLDLVVSGSDVYVLLGEGNGNFQAAVTYSKPGQDSQQVAVGDFNHDGAPDIAFCGPYGEVNLLYNNGKGTFTPGPHFSMGGGGLSVVSADFNNDGKPDLATGSYLNIGIFLNIAP